METKIRTGSAPARSRNAHLQKKIYVSPIEPSFQINKREYKLFNLSLWNTLVIQTYYCKNFQSLYYPTVWCNLFSLYFQLHMLARHPISQQLQLLLLNRKQFASHLCVWSSPAVGIVMTILAKASSKQLSLHPLRLTGSKIVFLGMIMSVTSRRWCSFPVHVTKDCSVRKRTMFTS
jgi:hypothetical protein